MTLHFRDRRRGASSLDYRNRAQITILMCEQKFYLVWFSCRHKSYPAKCEHSIISCADVLLSHYAVLQGCVRVGNSSSNTPGSRHDSKPRLQTINYPSKENKITYLGSFTTRATFWANLHVKMVSGKFSSSRDKAAIMAALLFPPEIKNSKAWNVIRLFAPPTPCNLFGNVASK